MGCGVRAKEFCLSCKSCVVKGQTSSTVDRYLLSIPFPFWGPGFVKNQVLGVCQVWAVGRDDSMNALHP